MTENFIGKYRIKEMEMWDKDYIDIEVPGYIELHKNGTADFQFGLVSGGGQYSYSKDGKYIDFRWEGNDEYDEASGEFELKINGNKMTGIVFLDYGDESALTAVREKAK